MKIYESAIRKPVTTALVFIAVIVLGLYSLVNLPVDLYPDMDAPYVSVMTSYPGANASEIETNITKILEDQLNGVDELKEITSKSEDNLSIITLEFDWGGDIDQAVNDVRSVIDLVYDDLPDGVSRPTVLKMSTSMMPVIMYSFTAKESYPGLQRILEDDVVNELNMIDGIGSVSLVGTPERYVYIDIDQKKLDTYKIPLETVGTAINANNLNLASGTVKMGEEQYAVSVKSEYIESDEIKNIVVSTTPEGKKIFVKDIGTVRDSIRDVVFQQKTNSQESSALFITKQSGANAVKICEAVKAKMEKIQKKLPPDIKANIIFDNSTHIRNSINGLRESIFYAFIFVVLVVWFFIGNWRATLIIGLTIPIALVTAFLYLYGTGSSINLISLSSLTIAIGMVVDDAIVVLENVSRHVARGENPREAAIYGTNEVWVSVIATTLVVVAVFVPLTMLGGEAGILFKELGWIVTIVVCTSTLVAISLTPMLSSKILKRHKMQVDEQGQLVEVKKKQFRFSYSNTVMKWLDGLDSWYSRVLGFCLRHKISVIIASIIVFLVSLVPVFKGYIGSEFMPTEDQSMIIVDVDLQTGTRLEKTIGVARRVEKTVLKVAPEIKLYSTSVGSDDNGGMSSLFISSSNSSFSLRCRTVDIEDRDRSVFEIGEAIRKELDKYPEIIKYNVNTDGMNSESNNTLAVEIYGYDFDKTSMTAENLINKFKLIPGARNILLDRESDRAELKIVCNKEKLSELGMSSSMVATDVRNRINGMEAGYLKEDGNEYDIVVKLEESNRNSITDIENFTLYTPAGKQIKLKEVADVEEYWCPPTITRKTRQRYCTVSITPVGTSLGELAANVQNIIDEGKFPSGVNVKISGSYEDQVETFSNMGALFLLIIFLVYVVMASQFESLKKPFMIMLSVPFAITGVILALLISGTNFNIVGGMGVILLVGIVVKNGIVLVDYIDLLRDRGYELTTAITEGGRSRLRPVLMTAMTTLLGMIPMAVSSSEGAEIWRPMGVAVIGGILVSTLVTLIIVPVFYSVSNKHGERDRKAKIQKNFVFMNIKSNNKKND